MEPAALFQPPLEYKDEYDVLYTHANTTPSYYTPHTDPLDHCVVRQHALQDQRRLHIRRLFDILQLMLLRRDMDRACRCLQILLKSQEWRPLELWKWGLQAMTLSDGENDAALQYLQRVSRTRPILRPFTLPYLIREWIVCGNYQKAYDELINVITTYPHRQNPQLHTYLGLLTLYAASVRLTSLNMDDNSNPFVPISMTADFPAQARTSAKVHFENAIKMAPKYIQSRTHVVRYREIRQNRRLHRLKFKAKVHRCRIWNQLRNAGWMFREPNPEPCAPQQELSDSSDGSLDQNSYHAPTHPSALPPSDFYGLASDFNDGSSLPSDSESNDDLSAPDGALSEGPEPRPAHHHQGPPTSPPHADSDGEEELVKEEDSTPSSTLSIPAVTWAVNVARIYLRMVRCMQTDNSWK